MPSLVPLRMFRRRFLALMSRGQIKVLILWRSAWHEAGDLMLSVVENLNLKNEKIRSERKAFKGRKKEKTWIKVYTIGRGMRAADLAD